MYQPQCMCDTLIGLPLCIIMYDIREINVETGSLKYLDSFLITERLEICNDPLLIFPVQVRWAFSQDLPFRGSMGSILAPNVFQQYAGKLDYNKFDILEINKTNSNLGVISIFTVVSGWSHNVMHRPQFQEHSQTLLSYLP